MPRKRTIRLLRAPNLARLRWLRHAFTLRGPGDFNLNYSVADSPATVTKNRRALLGRLDARGGAWQLVTLRQRHTDIVRVLAADGGDALGRATRERDGARKFVGDALVTDRPGLLLAVQVADCLSILLADPARRVVAAVHAGWRGTLAGIAAKTVGRMRQEFGSRPKELLAAFGPGIHRCCYEVGREVVERYEGKFDYWERIIRRVAPSPSQVHWQQPLLEPPRSFGTNSPRPRPAVTSPSTEKFYLDIVEANRRQLLAAGLQAKNIWVSPDCTACRPDRFFSHRAEHGRTGRMMGVVGIAPR